MEIMAAGLEIVVIAMVTRPVVVVAMVTRPVVVVAMVTRPVVVIVEGITAAMDIAVEGTAIGIPVVGIKAVDIFPTSLQLMPLFAHEQLYPPSGKLVYAAPF